MVVVSELGAVVRRGGEGGEERCGKCECVDSLALAESLSK